MYQSGSTHVGSGIAVGYSAREGGEGKTERALASTPVAGYPIACSPRRDHTTAQLSRPRDSGARLSVWCRGGPDELRSASSLFNQTRARDDDP